MLCLLVRRMFQDEADPEKIQRLIYKIQRLIYIVQSPNILCPQTRFSPFRQFFNQYFI